MTPEEYQQALIDIERYFEHPPEQGSPEAAEFDALADAIIAYEDAHYQIGGPT